jgi:hypothetical protein
VVGFIGLWNGPASVAKILLTSWVVKEKIVFRNSRSLRSQIEDLPLKCSIPKQNYGNKASGSKIARNPPQDPIRGWRLHHELIKTPSEN